MSVKNASILTGATVAFSAGSAFVFTDDGVTIPNGVHIVVPATADYRLRESVSLRFQPPTLMSDGSYARDTKTVTLTVPVLLASGKIINNVVRIERKVHPETAAATVVNYNKLAAQLLCDTDFDNFWGVGSLA